MSVTRSSNVSSEESAYLASEYASIEMDSTPLHKFLEEIYDTLVMQAKLSPNDSLLDMGCGRGYFLEYLRLLGFQHLAGIDPCDPLVEQRIFADVQPGSFENNSFDYQSFDVVMTSHTLHHLADPFPITAVEQMLSLARRYAVIIEINNTNLPMFGVSIWNRKVETNAWRYNLKRARRLFESAGGEIIYAAHMACGYISGDSLFHRALALTGARPYNIVIARSIK